jgi:hypothetical protein
MGGPVLGRVVSNRRQLDRALRLTIAAPCVVLASLSAWWIIGGFLGGGLWPTDEVTLSEAVATRNNAEAVRLIELGADPNRPSHVRDGLLTNGYDVTVRPVEAAVGAKRADSLRMLLANGALLDKEELLVLRCFEQTRRDSGVREILDARSPGAVDCDGVRSPVERTQ